ncbi:hypothetical protein T11_8329 [Trichinella zimbabwensis]|uniref:Uncharacterized protein n=1 Tax=Trichinella zimbabwensis TaxID=268475 RepID=A0A0V1GB32_9BILA|nr:hypothetical protein T11_8329 [Trichinella zimbabwensis]
MPLKRYFTENNPEYAENDNFKMQRRSSMCL